MKFWQRGETIGAAILVTVGMAWGASGELQAQVPPAGRADELRAQLESLQSQLDAVERNNAQRGKVTEIGSSRGRLRDADEPRLILKLYDLSDLFTVAPSYPAYEPRELAGASEPRPVFPHLPSAGEASGMGGMGGGFGGGGGFFAVPNAVRADVPATIPRDRVETLQQASGASGSPAASVRTSLEGLIDTITNTIAPDGWSDVGGPSTISPVGSSLLVSTTSETHAQLATLIDLFRQRWGSLRTIGVQAHWLWLAPSQVDALLAESRPGNAKDAPVAPGASPAPLNAISVAAWKKLLSAAAEKGNASLAYHAVVNCYNGQTVAAQSGTQRLVVNGIAPVVGGGKEVGYAPQVQVVQEGATLQITPLATRHAKLVVLDVHSRVNVLPTAALADEALKPAAGDVPQQVVVGDVPRQVVAALDRPALQTQRLETTLRIATGQPTLVGGMTFATAEGKSTHLYLFITASVQDLRDEEEPISAAGASSVPAKSDKAEVKPVLQKQ